MNKLYYISNPHTCTDFNFHIDTLLCPPKCHGTNARFGYYIDIISVNYTYLVDGDRLALVEEEGVGGLELYVKY